MNRADIIKLVTVVLVLALAVLLFGRVERVQGREETGIVSEAVKNAALTCYAVEGAYPKELDYLRERYQLAWDEDRYNVTYDYAGDNLFPDIYVSEVGAE
ncbi:MAG: hypothetical protein IJM56_06185 [Clostridia bacterium]|nr:hypothetical protein [Clostridia bacterium]MBQ9408548.1 hypothetical protein [Clostridia bacterium]